MQLSFGMEAGVRPQNTVRWVTDELGESIAFVEASIPKKRARQGTARADTPGRPVAYLYARQTAGVDTPIRVQPGWADLRFGSDSGAVADWLRLTGEHSTRRTETYGDTRSRWKLAPKWKDASWALEARTTATRPDIQRGLDQLAFARGRLLEALPDRARVVGRCLLSDSIHPIVLVTAWSDWMPTAIEAARRVRQCLAVDGYGEEWFEEWTVELDRLATAGHPHHDAIAMATTFPASANPVIARALAWVTDRRPDHG
jgi:hypothetical protein